MTAVLSNPFINILNEHFHGSDEDFSIENIESKLLGEKPVLISRSYEHAIAVRTAVGEDYIYYSNSTLGMDEYWARRMVPKLPKLTKLQKNQQDNDDDDLPVESEFWPSSYKVYQLPSSLKKTIKPKSGTTIVSARATDCPFGLVDLLGKLPESVEYLDLGHDGIVTIKSWDKLQSNESEPQCSRQEAIDVIKQLISGLPNLRKITYCGYYCQFEDELETVLAEYPYIILDKNE